MSTTQTDRITGVTTSVAIKAPCKAATTIAITLSGEQTVDGVSCVSGDRVLVKNQSDTTTNGVYVVSTSAWSRDADFDGSRDVVQGTLVSIVSGSTNSGTLWELSTSSPVIGTTNLTFTKIGTFSAVGTAGTRNLGTVIVDDGSNNLTIGSGQVTGGMIQSSASLAGSPTTTTQSTSDSSTKLATTAYVQAALLTVTPGLRNRIINGSMRIDQRNAGASQTLTAGAGVAYCVDRFYASCTGANVTGQQVAGTGADQYVYQFTGAASVTGILFGQRIEAANIYDLASTTVTLSAELANSLLTTVTWTAYYANSADNFSAKTQIATGTFTVTSTMTKYSAQIALPANAQNGVAVEFSVGAQTSGTWKIGQVQLEPGSAYTSFERSPLPLSLHLCQRYYWKSFAQGTAPAQNVGVSTGEIEYTASRATTGTQFSPSIIFPQVMRATPTLTFYNPSATNAQVRDITAAGDCSATASATVSDGSFSVSATGNASTAVGNLLKLHITASAEL